MNEEQRIGDISNHFGGLSVKTENGKFYWGIEDYDDYDWSEIPEKLYRALVKYESDRKKIA